ncbi:hypothetical protein BHE74_00016386 [Ensete ventricosum]|nr:hypothetical protein BHE74_00016386 [Ensete ventricosum]RZR79298.1 hypothetical protein BHM03_00005004 [Ensete ventricosum]
MLKCSGRSRELCSPATNLSSYFSCRLMSTLRFAWLSTIVTSMFVVLLRLRSPQCFERYYHGQLCHSYFRWMDWNIVVPIGSAHIRVVDVRGGIGAGASEVGHVRVDIDKGHPRPSSTGSDAKWSQRQWHLDERIRKQQEGEEDQKRLSRERKEEKKVSIFHKVVGFDCSLFTFTTSNSGDRQAQCCCGNLGGDDD